MKDGQLLSEAWSWNTTFIQPDEGNTFENKPEWMSAPRLDLIRYTVRRWDGGYVLAYISGTDHTNVEYYWYSTLESMLAVMWGGNNVKTDILKHLIPTWDGEPGYVNWAKEEIRKYR